ncbi:hypothetical protein Y032_0175g482 [Ancylostoma ceylanicum]|nr:hypothetical protein Y032_0175g482 [Ancylostoma ceylanicum]
MVYHLFRICGRCLSSNRKSGCKEIPAAHSSHLFLSYSSYHLHTLKDLLTSKHIFESKCLEANYRYCNEEKICELPGTLYMIGVGCGEKYIDETNRPLRKRLDEH